MDATFQVGDKAYYPVHGVAEVVALEQRDVGGQSTHVYILKVLESGLRIMVPTGNAAAVGLRALMDDDEIGEVYEILQAGEVVGDGQTWNRRHREYMDKLKTGSAFEIAEVLRDLCVLRATKDLSFGERRVLEQARGLLVKEIALATGKTEPEIDREIDSLFDDYAA